MIIKNSSKTNEYFYNGTMYCPMFGKEITVSIENEEEAGFDVKPYAEKCAAHLTNLSDEFIDKICERVSAYQQFMLEEWNEEFVEEINEKVPPTVSGRAILDYITKPMLVVESAKGDGIGYAIHGYCEWEPEHGIEIIILDDKLLYVGMTSCLGAWADDDEYEVDF